MGCTVGVGVVILGILITSPTCKDVGESVGFAASSEATEIPYFAAILVKVSPAWIVYVLEAGAVATGVGDESGATGAGDVTKIGGLAVGIDN